MSRNLCSAHRGILYAETGEKVLGPTPKHPSPASRSGLCRLTPHNVNEVRVTQKLSEVREENPVKIRRHVN